MCPHRAGRVWLISSIRTSSRGEGPSSVRSSLQSVSRDVAQVAVPGVLRGSIGATKGAAAMPRISVFHGVAISMYWDDHPPPHFHATHAGDEAKFDIDSMEVVGGRLPTAVVRRVREWAGIHRPELLAN